jgi:hypothetical protein
VACTSAPGCTAVGASTNALGFQGTLVARN